MLRPVCHHVTCGSANGRPKFSYKLSRLLVSVGKQKSQNCVLLFWAKYKNDFGYWELVNSSPRSTVRKQDKCRIYLLGRMVSWGSSLTSHTHTAKYRVCSSLPVRSAKGLVDTLGWKVINWGLLGLKVCPQAGHCQHYSVHYFCLLPQYQELKRIYCFTLLSMWFPGMWLPLLKFLTDSLYLRCVFLK